MSAPDFMTRKADPFCRVAPPPPNYLYAPLSLVRANYSKSLYYVLLVSPLRLILKFAKAGCANCRIQTTKRLPKRVSWSPFSRRATTLIESSQITNYLPPDRYVISVAGLIWAIDLLFKPKPGMIRVLGGGRGQAPPPLSRQFRETGSKLRPKLSA